MGALQSQLDEASPEVRAKAIQWAENNMTAFLSGFGKDGYCSEGVSYWNYGFGHFTHLAELLRWDTKGAVDLFKPAQVQVIAAAPSALELADGVYPAFADCGLNAAPDPSLVELLRWRLAAQPFSGNPAAPLAENTQIYFTLGDLAARSEAGAMGHAKTPSLPLRSWFPNSGVCVARPAKAGAMSAAWKGGHNAEHHNHNDVGTTLVAWRGRPILADPGAMVYNAKTFSKDRYRMPIMGSFGHSVPVVAGMLQAPGGKCAGRVVSTSFTDERDEVVIDLASAYPDSGLKQLTRHWEYRREGDASLVIEDRFEFTKPADFATALVGMGDWYLVNETENETSFLIDGGHDAVLAVKVESSGPRVWQVIQVPNPGKISPSRLGVGLKSPAATGWTRITISPAPSGASSKLTKIAPGTMPELLVDARRAPSLTAAASAPSF
ncbi:MAG: heparinase II/III-family protein [Akkermansiaceae bacterium]|nr:heparinase II/III-family protein [Akkermansiaceae bacterium]